VEKTENVILIDRIQIFSPSFKEGRANGRPIQAKVKVSDQVCRCQPRVYGVIDIEALGSEMGTRAASTHGDCRNGVEEVKGKPKIARYLGTPSR
jgi:hypothetical protein